ncbi:unnamed protein product [Plutella xylostella]|uniref:(diamondback moth) hypothetical protein n=1 Tax=Plutella xylostella TaxID=51655 RepID=A0A8S4CX48_PLUXY|nr:unnamed protein product [Plutella xylostella]
MGPLPQCYTFVIISASMEQGWFDAPRSDAPPPAPRDTPRAPAPRAALLCSQLPPDCRAVRTSHGNKSLPQPELLHKLS